MIDAGPLFLMRPFFILLTGLSVTVPAAAREEVVVLTDHEADRSLSDALRLELGAEGFAVRLERPGGDVDSVQTLLEARGAVAAIWVAPGPPPSLCVLHRRRLVRAQLAAEATTRTVALVAAGVLGDAMSAPTDTDSPAPAEPQALLDGTDVLEAVDAAAPREARESGAAHIGTFRLIGSLDAVLSGGARDEAVEGWSEGFEWRALLGPHLRLGESGALDVGGAIRMDFQGTVEPGLIGGALVEVGLVNIQRGTPDGTVAAQLMVGGMMGGAAELNDDFRLRALGRVLVGVLDPNPDVARDQGTGLGLGVGAECALDAHLFDSLYVGLSASVDVRVATSGPGPLFIQPALSVLLGVR